MKSNILLISLLLGLCIEGLSFPDIDSYYFVYPDNGQYPSISAALDSAKAYNDSTPVIMVFTPIMPMDTVILTDAFVSVSIIGQSAYGSMNTGLSSTDIIDSSDCVLQLEKLMSFNYKNHRGIRNSKIFINDCFLDNIYNRGNIDWEIFNSTIATDSTVGSMSSYDGFCTYVYFTDITWKFQSQAMANCIYNNGRSDSLIFIIQNDDMSFFYDTYHDRYTMTAHNDTLTFEDGMLHADYIVQRKYPPILRMKAYNAIIPHTLKDWNTVHFDSIEVSDAFHEYAYEDLKTDCVVFKKNCIISVNAQMPYAALELDKIPVYMRISINGKTELSDIDMIENQGMLSASGTVKVGSNDTLRLEYYTNEEGIVFVSPKTIYDNYSAMINIVVTE